jgi:glutamyl-tRNA reductase
MHILTVGLNHKTASVDIREQLTFSNNRLQMALRKLRSMKSILECVIVSTCNRMEIYIVCDQIHTGEYYSKTFLESWFRISKELFVSHLYIKRDLESVDHLFQVVCGLDSIVLGETQILGQVRKSFLTAQSLGTTGTIFNMLFKQAITLGKVVHSKKEIGQNAFSVSYAAVGLARKIFDTFEGKTVLLIGTGEMSILTAKHFYDLGASRILILSRTFIRAKGLASRFNGEARPWEQLSQSLSEADIVVSATESSKPVLTRSIVESVMHGRCLPLYLIDIAVPRNIDSTVQDLERIFLYNIDDLYKIVDMNKLSRGQEIQNVHTKIEREKKLFQKWIHTLGVVPLISALRGKAIRIQEETMARIERKLPELTDHEKRVIRKQTKSIVNQLLRDPIIRIKELVAHKEEALDMFIYLLALEEQLDRQRLDNSRSVFDLTSPTFIGEKVSIY